jgi:hypothetical protein
MSLLSEKYDSVTDIYHETKEMGVASTTSAMPSGIDITAPQAYDLKNIKWDLVYNGAYSLRASGTETEVWNVKIHYRSLEIFRADGSLVGTANLHQFSTRVEVSMHDHSDSEQAPSEFTMTRNKGIFNESKSFTVQGQKLTWKRATKLGAKFNLVDEAGNVVAWIGPTSWRGKHKFEVVRAGMDAELVEACMVTALATAENEKRRMCAASSAASASSASVAVSV